MLHTYLNRLKEERNMTNQEIADASGVAPGTVGRIFSGHAKNPGYEAVVAIVRALGGDMNTACEILSADPAHAPAVPITPPADSPTSAVPELARTFDELARRKDESHQAAIEHVEKSHQADMDRLERVYEHDRRRQHSVIVILSVLLGLFVVGNLIMIGVDIMTPTKGWINSNAFSDMIGGLFS